MHYYTFLIIRLLILCVIAIIASRWFYLRIVRQNTSTIKSNVGLAFYTSLIVLIFLEAIFTLIPRSHGNGMTYAAKNWFAYNWQLNDEGYRDMPFDSRDQSKKRLGIIGDSFTAGQGLKVKHRFSSLLSESLSDEWEVHNFGVNGNSTLQQIQQVHDLRFDLDQIVLQYYPNDIQSNAELIVDDSWEC